MSTFDVVAFFAENGHPEYRDRIRAIEEKCAVGDITAIDADGQIDAIYERLTERLEDSKTDMLP